MRKMLLKLRILLTNASRVIMGLFFVNLKFLYSNKVFGVSINEFDSADLTCYLPANSPTIEEPGKFSNILIIFLPLAIIIGFIILIIKKKKNKHKED